MGGGHSAEVNAIEGFTPKISARRHHTGTENNRNRSIHN
jgi:hypothetical protein